MSTQTELGGFLRTRRARLRPGDAGLPDYGDRRRVPGLRREEVAQLAGVSLGYYTRLEQGQSGHASDAVLDAVAEVLRLNDEERGHLHLLATRPRVRRRARPERLRPDVARLVDCFGATPALVMGRRADVLHWNPAARALLASHLPLEAPGHRDQRPNLAKMVFLDPRSRGLYADWARKSHDVVAYLRIAAARWPHDGALTSLVGELCIRSPAFSELWASHPVRVCAHNTRDYLHPLVGPLTLHDEVLSLPDDDGQWVATFYAEPGTTSASSLERLVRIASAR